MTFVKPGSNSRINHLHTLQALLRVVLQPDLSHLEDVSAFQMRLEVNSSNHDTLDQLTDNVVDIDLPVRVKTNLTIRG